MRLYRALTVQEYDVHSKKFELNSDSRAFDNNSLSNDINLLDEVYSHIMPTHKLPSAQSRRIIFSFTDNIKVAYRFLTRFPEHYKTIGYIDFDIPENPINIQSPEISCIIPIFRTSDWISLAAHYNTTNVHNVNYDRDYPTKLSSTLIPSRWGALSLAGAAREYAVICNRLVPELLHSKVKCGDQDPFTLDLGRSNRARIIDTVKKEIAAYNIQPARKSYIIQSLQ